MKYKIIFILIISLAILFASCDKRKARLALLVGDPSIENYYSLESDSVTMYASPSDKKAGKIECRIFKDEYDSFVKMFRYLDDESIVRAYQGKAGSRFSADVLAAILAGEKAGYRFRPRPSSPLAGLRVAIDPGHSAGSMKEAIREDKYMWLFAPDGKRITFFEARINLATAETLKDMLEKAGATVMLTRGANRQVYPVPFDRWVATDFKKAVHEKLRDNHITRYEADRLLYWSSDRMRLKFFNSEYEMPYRAKIINAFRPHITVLVHYDACEDDNAYKYKYLKIKEIMKKQYPTYQERLEDINMVIKSVAETTREWTAVFIPGCFLKNELMNMESRIEFLRLIISPDLDNSARYSKYVLDNFRRYLKLTPADSSYPGASQILVGENGLFARNFRMTRLVRGILCLGEALQQNNINEALQLGEINEGKVPDRIKIVAKAYYDSIRKFARLHL